jgi:hypothetical protein
MSKNKTNRQVLAKAVRDLSDLDLVFMRDRLLDACDEVIDNADEIRKQNQGALINPDLMIAACQQIKAAIDF